MSRFTFAISLQAGPETNVRSDRDDDISVYDVVSREASAFLWEGKYSGKEIFAPIRGEQRLMKVVGFDNQYWNVDGEPNDWYGCSIRECVGKASPCLRVLK